MNMKHSDVSSFFKKENMNQKTTTSSACDTEEMPPKRIVRPSSTMKDGPGSKYIEGNPYESILIDESRLDSIVKKLVEKELASRIDEIRMLVRCVVNEIMDEELKKPKKKPNASKNNLSVFLHENQKYVMPLVSESIKTSNDMRAVFQSVIKTIWFHPEHKENNIVYIRPSSFNSITVHKERGWHNYEIAPTLVSMIQRANDVLQEFTIGLSEEEENKMREKFGDAKYQTLNEFTNRVDNMDDDPKFLKRMLKDTENTILTSQHLVHTTIFDIPDK